MKRKRKIKACNFVEKSFSGEHGKYCLPNDKYRNTMNLPPIKDFTRCAICGKKDGCKTVKEAHRCPYKIEIQQEKKLLKEDPVEWQKFIREERDQPW